ncbi:phosphotransacetylase [Streptococcus pneumoniae]|uniref:Phosphate acetyltransferase n=1 Tax=Stutzerimonas stutzeri (strain ATCC 17588 / DSM 5190 / CCUG 11256 / JCM 5965 / LMG 11199 / NBRC 14165 / NCIMB 11358 / Stanier 221) TaxID=96563 RepID=F8H0K4_STUS2|nr:phosphate acetyltransferase [Stutzerimonas stutzeri]CJL54782.1 phosphotransacetylase [Streptococcus pneumoniae]AEJ04311.1 phosphate acetyltransferase [Stutzerimonas stutzeri]MCC8343971.1 phosphate acetyltransferase [Stutzerimonas stutzeri]MCQ4231194.1 phosphate acetyltransferase [Stutzerimonas stutzeri]QPT29383.1 phosphate acetyltransferase [Stutzerimonas stutzeri]
MHTLFLAPTGFGGGLNSISLGLIRALESAGLKVGFFKPIAQPFPVDQGRERSCILVERTLNLTSPEPLPLEQVERQLADGEIDLLLEDVVSRFQQVAVGKDVVIVEGMVPTRESNYTQRINTQLAKSLDAEVILIAAQGSDSLKRLAERIEIQAQLYGGAKDPKVLGVILNKVKTEEGLPAFVDSLKQHLPLLGSADFQLLGTIPFSEELNALRTRDIAELLGAQVLNAGEADQRRVNKIVLCARAVPNTVQLLRSGVLVVTPGDRDDIILAASLASLNGEKLAGLLLCSDFAPDPRILELCKAALDGGLPVMTVETNSYDTANNLFGLNKETPADDIERATRVTDFIAKHLHPEFLHTRCSVPRGELRMSPAAFRYQLVKRAQDANKRIVLPEGNEPRTIRAAAICQERGIARCVLLAKPEEVQQVAREQGITLPASLEILDPDSIANRYVEPMCEMRKAKGLTPDDAREQLKDTVVLGTMMLALDEVDGLVSGAVHTTANTIRPALQLIKTAPGYSLVSSVFFMLLPDQVLVYGDCAVNPNPSATELAEIALQSAESAVALGVNPRVAMISYSTGSSGSGAEVEKVAEATRIAQERAPDLPIDGPLQYDAASVLSVGRQKAPNSKVAGQATVFIFPDLNTGNTTYKAVQRNANCLSVGPMLQGLAKPVNDLSRGALVDDIVFTIALTALQAANQKG